MSDPTLFADIAAECCQGPTATGCVCSPKEQVVRMYAAGRGSRPLTPQERANLVDDADHAGEGYYSAAELAATSDQELASATLHAWGLYAQSQ